MQYYECKVSLLRTTESGEQKTVKELYIVAALSVTEAEANVIKGLQNVIKGPQNVIKGPQNVIKGLQNVIKGLQSEREVNVISVKDTKYEDVQFSLADDDSRWYRVKLNIIQVDEKTGKEKKTPSYILMQGANLFEITKSVRDLISSSVLEKEVVSISETAIVDFFDDKIA